MKYELRKQGTGMTISSAVVIPTRNRPELARNAVQSVLNQGCDNVRLLVSDNSTTEENKRELAEFCAKLNHPRLTYVTPPEPLPMPQHWEFAVGRAERLFDATHYTILTDRMMLRDGMFRLALDLATETPEQVIAYNDEMVHDQTAPYRLDRKNLTGQQLDLDAGHLLYLSSLGVFPQALPRMLNCVVPRAVLQRVRSRFGDAFKSVAPDLCFAYRTLEVCNLVRYLDAPVMVQYGFAKSNGTGYYGEKANDAWKDFNKNAGLRGLTFASPISEICCNVNVVYHEYCFVREQAQSMKFPEVDWKRYVHIIANDIHYSRNTELKGKLFALLKARVGDDLLGWTPPPQAADLAPRSSASKAWTQLRRLVGIPSAADPLEFDSSIEALKFSNRFPPKYAENADHLGFLHKGWAPAA